MGGVALVKVITCKVKVSNSATREIKLGSYMNDKVFEIWQKKREQGFLSWLFKSTLGAVAFYLVFSIVFQYSSISEQGVPAFIQSQASNYALFTILMLIGNGVLWLYREASYKKEARRRNIL
ncbi:hypothetical protein VSU01S_16720 [Vibrio superstes NBRC 103154]|uniref:Uncharacterized protein n=2 Tax=Vibrio superstes TaxID=198815 RepID=A0A511QQS8_9VIBR|nr:hypothetical protein VSU01S_16720 [Vibrio superstes NBRC 103154]